MSNHTDTAASNAQVLRATEDAATALRRKLAAVIADAEGALARMDAGQRPSYTMSGAIFGQSVTDAEAAAQRLALCLEFAGTLLAPADALAAVRNS